MKNIPMTGELTGILFITSYPPRECGIATYSQDLIKALNNKFSSSFSIQVCALESNGNTYPYPDEVKYILKTSQAKDYKTLAMKINGDDDIQIVVIQHEFGFYHKQEKSFLEFLNTLKKPVAIVFHTVLPHPDASLKLKVLGIAAACDSVIVMTHNSAGILTSEYGVPEQKISMIAHGTHLVPHLNEKFLKQKYGFSGKKVLTTFGLLSSGKSIETTLDAMPAIVEKCPETMFLVIGKTHPEVVKTEGEKYRTMLEQKVKDLALQEHVMFINKYLALPELLEYLQLTDIYLFTSNDPNQAVSGTFVYAMSCACPIISTPIPHAVEILTRETGIIIGFNDPKHLAISAISLLNDTPLRKNFSTNTLEKIVSTVWENSAVAHAMLFEKLAGDGLALQYDIPAVNLDHLKQMTTGTGMIQFSRVNQPDIRTGYTLDDNARAMIALCMQYRLTGGDDSMSGIRKYLDFIARCQQPGGEFLNYMDKENNFTEQNEATNLDDSNGRAIWALGYLVSLNDLLPAEMLEQARTILDKSLLRIDKVHSTRAMAFVIKGLYHYQNVIQSPVNLTLIKTFADRLVQMYKHEANPAWEWFEGYLTYANSILPEALLYAWLLTRETIYKETAVASLDFLLEQIFNENGIEVISNKHWLRKGDLPGRYGEQPIDVAYTIMTLGKFYDVFMDDGYRVKMETAFNWFLGNNRLHQIIYNPCTGGCYDGLEETHVNLNQGAESTVSYLMARLTMQKYQVRETQLIPTVRFHSRVQTRQWQRVYSTDYNKQLSI